MLTNTLRSLTSRAILTTFGTFCLWYGEPLFIFFGGLSCGIAITLERKP